MSWLLEFFQREPHMRLSLCISASALLIAAASPGASAQTGAAAAAPQARTAAGPPVRRPPLLFKEEWKQNEKGDEHAATQDSVGSPNLVLTLYGATGKDLQITGKAGDENNPIHIWSGNCTSPCALALRDKTNFADLMPGSGHGPGGWVDVAQIEVYARAVLRSSASQ